MEHIAYLALGSNLGNRASNLKNAIDNLTPQMVVKKKSHIYETAPWGFANQPAFFNQVVRVETYLSPEKLIGHLKRLETALGRVPNFQNGPRLIDMDILFFDDLVLDAEALKVPHPRLHERAFVLVPLNEIGHDLMHPVMKKSVGELLSTCDVSGVTMVSK